MAITIDNLETEIASVGGFDATEEATTITRFAVAGLRGYEQAAAWPWLKNSFEVTMVADQHNYDLEDDVAADFMRFDTKTLRFGGRRLPLVWTRPEVIDEHLGPEWKTASGASGQVEFATRVGNELWVARKPSAAVVASHPKLYGYYYRNEPTADGATLYLPAMHLHSVAICSLSYGWLAEDDPRATEMYQRWHQTELPKMMSANTELGTFDRLEEPDWMHDDNTDGFSDYGDEPPY